MNDEAFAQRKGTVDQRRSRVSRAKGLGVENRGRATVAKAQLVQARAGAHPHAEAARRNLGEQRPGVADRNMVESVGAVGDEAGEDVEPPRRAFRIGRAGKPGGSASCSISGAM